MQSLAHETNAGVNRECGRLPNAVLSLPLEMSAVNTKRCTGCSMQSPCAAACRAVPAEYWMVLMPANKTVHGLLNAVSVCGCLQGSPCRTVNGHRRKQTQENERMDGWIQTRCTGCPMQSRGAAAYRAVPAARAMILVHMVMNGGKCNKG